MEQIHKKFASRSHSVFVLFFAAATLMLVMAIVVSLIRAGGAWGTGLGFTPVYQTVLLSSLFFSLLSGALSIWSYRKKAKQSEAASRAKSNFLAVMSHEIRTPLNAVIGISEIELRNKLPGSSRDNIAQIHQSGSALLGIINDILDISKIEAGGGIELAFAEYITPQLISDIVYLAKNRLGSKPVVFILDIQEHFPLKLIGDERRVRQILNNILSNADKYTEEGSIELKIRSEELEGEGQQKIKVCFTISDTGIGIRQKDIKNLFTGLGLVITKSLVEMMGGSISVKSEFGKGSVFSVEIIQGTDCSQSPDKDFPCIGEETAQALRSFCYETEKKHKDIVSVQIPKGKVLVVDDLPVNLLVARGLLNIYNLSIDTASSGQEAIDMVKQQSMAGNRQYDLIFMDHMMPKMDGIETVKAIRAWEKEQREMHVEFAQQTPRQLSGIPIIALTANAMLGMNEFYLEQGFQGYITKPIDPDILDDTVKRLIPQNLQQNPEKETKSSAALPVSTGNKQLNQSSAMVDQYLDILNHFQTSFTHSSDHTKFNAVYFDKFCSLIGSLEKGKAANEQAVLLKEAASRGDVSKILEILPSYCQEKKQAGTSIVQQSCTKASQSDILIRLKKAVLNGENERAEAILGELGAISLEPFWREIYFLLYDLFLAGDYDKVLGAIMLWERTERFLH